MYFQPVSQATPDNHSSFANSILYIPQLFELKDKDFLRIGEVVANQGSYLYRLFKDVEKR